MIPCLDVRVYVNMAWCQRDVEWHGVKLFTKEVSKHSFAAQAHYRGRGFGGGLINGRFCSMEKGKGPGGPGPGEVYHGKANDNNNNNDDNDNDNDNNKYDNNDNDNDKV